MAVRQWGKIDDSIPKKNLEGRISWIRSRSINPEKKLFAVNGACMCPRALGEIACHCPPPPLNTKWSVGVFQSFFLLQD